VTSQSTQTLDVLCRAYHYLPEWWLAVCFTAGIVIGLCLAALERRRRIAVQPSQRRP